MTVIAVPFAGEGAGEDELSWGQQDIWGSMRRDRSWLPIGFARPVPPGTTVEDIVDELRWCVSRYPSLRTRLRFTGGDRPRQVVYASGEVELEVVDAPPDADPAAVAKGVQDRYQGTDHDHAAEWPVRMAVVRHLGAPAYQVMVVCHLVVDGFGALVMQDGMRDRPSGPGAALEPLEQAREQRTPAAVRRSEAALRHWEHLLRTTAADRYPGSADPRTPRYWEVVRTSPALHLAVERVAARARVESSTVLLAAYAMAMSAVTGIAPLLTQLVVGNRFRPGLATTVSPVSQTALCRLDVAGREFDDALAVTWRAALAGYKHSYYDPAALDALLRRVAAERPDPAVMRCGFNDRRGLLRDLPPADPAADPRAALAHTTTRVERRQDKPFDPCYLHVLQEPGAVVLVLCADTHFLGPDQQEDVLRRIEETVVDAASRGGH
ncbi:condensation domain-containing protein [Phytohabitans houttuyneae]|uniref:condensation domain-containing protein n=1 Tax=Phytohabitans houttuyneae TaxID=1076126 RepID=UPI0015630C53|nr:condensation domain-containing protein [Phytohabitans houttuyneae]